MKTLYLECNSGAAGDMLTAALLELIPDREAFINKMNSLGIPHTSVSAETASRCGINGTFMRVTVHGEEEGEHHHGHENHHHDGEHHHEHEHHNGNEHHHHSSMSDIEALIGGLDVSERVKSDVLETYRLIAEAESAAHGRPVSEIHFHEVGTMDAVADIVGVCLLMERLAPDRVIASPVCTGFGEVRCAHGILPVPAPATAFILKDIPVYAGSIEGEMCTPTGAALLRKFADSFGQMPVMRVEKTGYGMGKKELPKANCVRAFLGETEESGDTDEVCELKCNIDDMTGEELGFAAERLLECGALDVFTVPAGMKKSRPGTLLVCLCRPEEKARFAKLLFKYTTTLGVRETLCGRYVLRRTETLRDTQYGKVKAKVSEGYGVKREKAEYDELARIAREHDVSIKDIKLQ